MDKSSFAYINIALVKNKAVFLRNPQLFYTEGGARQLVQDATQTKPEHATLTTELAGIAAVDVADLALRTWPALSTKAAAEIGPSEPQP